MAKSYHYHKEYSKYPPSKIIANEIGEVYYYTGKKCKNNHISPRYASSSNCVQCIAEKRNVVKINKRGGMSLRSAENQRLTEDAHNLGYTTYISKKKCPKGHYERYVTSNNCVQCDKEAREKRKISYRWNRIKRIYNISKEQYYKMLEDQDSKCLICGADLFEKNCHIDHNHKNGKVRGLLCSRCNQAIGLLNEDMEILKKAYEYIKKNNP